MEKITLQIKRGKIQVCSQMWKAQLSNKYSRMIAACDLVSFHLDATLSSTRVFLGFPVASEMIPLEEIQL